jgi:radical SAM enzyme (TIGR01210 family)
VARAFERGTWRPPWLWSVVEVLRQTAHLGHMDVGLSDEGMGPAMVAHNCPACSERVRRALARFNATADLQHLAGLDCACRAQWRALAPDPGPFAAREAT